MPDRVPIRCPFCGHADAVSSVNAGTLAPTPFACRACRRTFDPFPEPLHAPAADSTPATLDYFAEGFVSGESVRNPRAVRCLLLGLAAAVACISIGLVVPDPAPRHLMLLVVALAALAAGWFGAATLLTRHDVYTDRTLCLCGMGLGGLSLAAVVVLF